MHRESLAKTSACPKPKFLRRKEKVILDKQQNTKEGAAGYY